MTIKERIAELRNLHDQHAACSDALGRINLAAHDISIPALLDALSEAVEALGEIRVQTGLDDPNFGDFTPLQFAARHGLIDYRAKDALARIAEILGGGR